MSAYMPPLTARQQEVYDYIVRESAHSRHPSFRDLMRHFGVKSTNGVKCHIDALVKKGYVSNDGLARGIRPTQSAIAKLCVEAYKALHRLQDLGENVESLQDALKPFESKGTDDGNKADQVPRRRRQGVG